MESGPPELATTEMGDERTHRMGGRQDAPMALRFVCGKHARMYCANSSLEMGGMRLLGGIVFR